MEAKLAVKAIILNRELHKLLLIQRSGAEASGAGTWEGVGGKIEPGESPEEAMRREIREEVGIEDIDMERIAYVSLRHDEKPLLIIAYLCYTYSQQVQLSREHQAYCWADRAECERLLPDAILKDFHEHHVFELVGLK